MGRPAMKKSRRETRRNAKQEQSRRQLQLVETIGNEPYPIHKPKRDKIEPWNERQADYLKAMQTCTLVVAVGSAGSSKTFLSSAYGADLLLEHSVERIVVTRPVLQADEDLGFLPGDISEKFAPYFRPVYEVLRERLGRGFLEYALKPEVEKILVSPFAYLRGMTFKDSFVLLDEAQNTTVNQMKLFLTRIGEGSVIVINGDVNQCDLPKGVKSGLVDLLERIEAKNSEIPVIKFTDADCVRSEICKLALDLYS